MADSRLERLSALLRAESDKKNNQKPSTGDNASYPFWDIPENQTATVRFLPDADDSNPFFWVQKETIKMPFSGVVGGDFPSDRPVTVNVPCIDMFGETCPVIAATRPWWRDDAKKDLARTYWKKKSYIFQGFVVASPFEEKAVPENPIRRFVIGPTLYEIIKESLVNPEMEFIPVDYTGGRDFKITKTKKGDWANYGTSQWSFRTRALSESEQIAIERFGLHNLKDFLGSKPDADAVAAIKAMFEASVAGDPFDMVAFGKYYRPYGVGGGASSAPASTSAPQTTVEATPVREASPAAPAPAPAPAASSKPAPQDILAKLREKTAAANRG